MATLLIAVAVALFAWWFLTGVILWLVHHAVDYHRMVFVLWTSLMVPVAAGVSINAEELTVISAITGFVLALLLWGWLELGYLIGWITGPREKACPANASVAKRIFLGLGTCLYHELALLSLAGMIFYLCWQAPNMTTASAFAVLWFMRWSAKLNMVLGVRNYNSAWLPVNLAYLDTFIPKRHSNGLFPISLLCGLTLSVFLVAAAINASFLAERISWSLLACLAVLGTLEHLFLMLPLGDAVLWQWAAPRTANAVDSTRSPHVLGSDPIK